ncbi:hypothetical protein [Psychrobacter celer]|uniref:hypothetical protein n=1 Tax=Psychrobacter celer TaxID=306572 RepID=UPI003FD410DB
MSQSNSHKQAGKRGHGVIKIMSITACLLMLLLIASCQPVSAKPFIKTGDKYDSQK